jgi:hypothetical protein
MKKYKNKKPETKNASGFSAERAGFEPLGHSLNFA